MGLRRVNPYRELEKRIGYRFRKRRFIETALLHRSFRFENKDVASDNQRLEFLGDAVLGFAAADYLFATFPDVNEGVLTAYRSLATSGKALATLAVDIDLGSFILLGKGEHHSGGRERASNLADALESVIGAAYLDGGMKAVNKVFNTLFVPVLEECSGDVWADNPKGKLQELSQRRWKMSPRYRIAHQHGPAHATVFTIEVCLHDGTRAQGSGPNKQAAEIKAAAHALKHLSAAHAK